MNLKIELQKMEVSDLKFVCRELGVSCPKTKRSIIKKLLLPLNKKYKKYTGKFLSEKEISDMSKQFYDFERKKYSHLHPTEFPGNPRNPIDKKSEYFPQKGLTENIYDKINDSDVYVPPEKENFFILNPESGKINKDFIIIPQNKPVETYYLESNSSSNLKKFT